MCYSETAESRFGCLAGCPGGQHQPPLSLAAPTTSAFKRSRQLANVGKMVQVTDCISYGC